MGRPKKGRPPLRKKRSDGEADCERIKWRHQNPGLPKLRGKGGLKIKSCGPGKSLPFANRMQRIVKREDWQPSSEEIPIPACEP
ncbi:hypothetical protein MTO96_002363 [Rhipicephalus appendiculatus]